MNNVKISKSDLISPYNDSMDTALTYETEEDMMEEYHRLFGFNHADFPEMTESFGILQMFSFTNSLVDEVHFLLGRWWSTINTKGIDSGVGYCAKMCISNIILKYKILSGEKWKKLDLPEDEEAAVYILAESLSPI